MQSYANFKRYARRQIVIFLLMSNLSFSRAPYFTIFRTYYDKYQFQQSIYQTMVISIFALCNKISLGFRHAKCSFLISYKCTPAKGLWFQTWGPAALHYLKHHQLQTISVHLTNKWSSPWSGIYTYTVYCARQWGPRSWKSLQIHNGVSIF